MDPPSIDHVLDAFGRDDSIARHPATSRRSADTRKRLLAYLATDASRVLSSDERALLTAERQFAPDGAFTRVFGADVLVAALPGFLEAGWLPRDAFDARAQVRSVELLCDWIVARGLVDAGEMSCIIYGVLDSARAARVAVGTGSRELDTPLEGESTEPLRPAVAPSGPGHDGAQTLPGLEQRTRPDLRDGTRSAGPADGAGHGSLPKSAEDCGRPRRRGPTRSAGQGA